VIGIVVYKLLTKGERRKGASAFQDFAAQI
jgi:hypothetical protein